MKTTDLGTPPQRWAVLRYGPGARRAGLIRDMFPCADDPAGVEPPCEAHEHIFLETDRIRPQAAR